MPLMSRPSTKNSPLSQPRIIQSRFENTCTPCGKKIMTGDLIYYDRWSAQRVLCIACGSRQARLAAQGLTAHIPPPEHQIKIDRLRQLLKLHMPGQSARAEIHAVIKDLKDNYADKSEVRKYLLSLVECSDNDNSFVCIRCKYIGFCVHCNARQKMGETVFYDKKAHTIHCFDCDIPAFRAGRLASLDA